MRRLKRFLVASWQERWLLLQALFWVLAIRIGLCLLPFGKLKELTGNVSKARTHPYSADQCVWAVRATSRCVPAATCLTQALAGQVLLARSGYDSRLEIGVAKTGEAGFEAHAWLICANRIVIGGQGVDKYVPLASWDHI